MFSLTRQRFASSNNIIRRCTSTTATTAFAISSSSMMNNNSTAPPVKQQQTNISVASPNVNSSSFIFESKRFQASTSSSTTTPTSYRCSACGKAFRLINALAHHINTKHGGEAKSIPLDASGNPIADGSQTSSSKPATSSTTTTSSSIPVPGPQGVVNNTNNNIPQQQQQQQQQVVTEEEMSKKGFVCHICQKSFRIQNALNHHLLTKHGIEKTEGGESSSTTTIPPAPPSGTTTTTGQQQHTPDSSTSTSTTTHHTTVSASDAASSTNNNNNTSTTSTSPSSTSTTATSSQQYQFHKEPATPVANVNASETVTSPLPPQYHLDVAPNAPEEREIAVHYNCVNNIVLMGEQVQDVSEGYVFEDKVLQFVVTTLFENPSPGDPDRDFHTVRVYLKDNDCNKERSFGTDIKEELLKRSNSTTTTTTIGDKISKKVMVSGRLRMVPQYEPTTGRYYHFPVVQVQEGSGYVRCV